MEHLYSPEIVRVLVKNTPSLGRGRRKGKEAKAKDDSSVPRVRPEEQRPVYPASDVQAEARPSSSTAQGARPKVSSEAESGLTKPPLIQSNVLQTPRALSHESIIAPKPLSLPSTAAPETSSLPSAPTIAFEPSRAEAQSSQVQALAHDVTRLSLEVKDSRDEIGFAVRPNRYEGGTLILLLTNYFILNFKDTDIYHYDIDIVALGKRGAIGKSLMREGRTAKEAAEKGISHLQHQQGRNIGKTKCREIIAEMLRSSRQLEKYKPVYDGQKNLYTREPLPITKSSSFTVNIKENDVMKDFQVIIRPVEKEAGMSNIISLEPLRQMREGRTLDVPHEILMALDTVLCHRDPPFTQETVGRSFFSLDESEREELGEGYEIWFGYNQSIHLTEVGPAVLVNVAAKAFHAPGPVLKYASEVLRKDVTKVPFLNNRDIKKLSECLSKVKVQVNHLAYPRKYLVKSVTTEAAKDKMFELEEDGRKRKISVARYFVEKYKRLKYPNLPCLHMKTNISTTFIPIECCEIFAGQPKIGKLDVQLTTKMIKKTNLKPSERFGYIGKYATDITEVSGESMKHFDLQMNLNSLVLKGRIITAPTIQYSDQSASPIVQPDKRGTWTMRDKKFKLSVNVTKWVIISFAAESYCSLESLWFFTKSLCRVGQIYGLIFSQPLEIKIFDSRCKTREALLHAQKLKPQLVVVILSKKDAYHCYEEVKFIADVQLRLVTQCMDEEVVVDKMTDQVLNNICLKVNFKLGGINHTLQQRPGIFRKPVIIIGVDSAHPMKGSTCPSIASVVGSLDAFPAKYAVTCRVLKSSKEGKRTQEIILELKDMIKDILKTFTERTRGKRPEKIILYRDGVSEGQFSRVLNNEVFLVQKACHELYGGYVPPLTFIVVQKNHQTRFKPLDSNDGVGKMKNVPPGTTVDTVVTKPAYFDFFICSHLGIQGTSKPAHYTVLFDKNNFKAEELFQLTYFLCHTYSRCNKSISIPAPIMYADLAAARAKKYVDLHTDRISQMSEESEDSPFLPQEVLDAINSMENFTTGMFFV